jgi:hypothetical protein
LIDPTLSFTPQERTLIKETSFFQRKAIITQKVKLILLQLHEALKEELATASLLAPEEVDTEVGQFVKGEHLHDLPYQYLDLPKYFSHTEKFTFRSLFWWGHHFVFAMILEGKYHNRYTKNLLENYDVLADQGLHLLLAPTPWEWRNNPEFLLEIRRDNRKMVAATLVFHPWLKIHRFIDFDSPLFENGNLVEEGRTTFRLMKVIVSP